jgi:hypothetical protein
MAEIITFLQVFPASCLGVLVVHQGLRSLPRENRKRWKKFSTNFRLFPLIHRKTTLDHDKPRYEKNIFFVPKAGKFHTFSGCRSAETPPKFFLSMKRVVARTLRWLNGPSRLL